MCQVQLKQTCEPREQINFEKGSHMLERGLICMGVCVFVCVWLGCFCCVAVIFAVRLDNEINVSSNNNSWSWSQLSEAKDDAGTWSWLCKYLASWLFVADNWPQNLFNMPSNSNFMPHCLCNWPTFWGWGGFLQCGSGSTGVTGACRTTPEQTKCQRWWRRPTTDDRRPSTGDSFVPHTLLCCQWQQSGSRNNFIKFTWCHPQKYVTKGLCNCARASNMPAAYLHTSRLLAFLSLCLCVCVHVRVCVVHAYAPCYLGILVAHLKMLVIGNAQHLTTMHKQQATRHTYIHTYI